MTIVKTEMTTEQFKNRDEDLKNYGYEGTVQ
jgi:hypothetical protein